MRHIAHPGPASLERTADVAGTPVPLRFVLEPGDTVDAAIAQGFAAAGCVGGYVTLRGGTCDPFRFVMPAASPDANHAAWYSDTFAPVGPVRIERAGAIVGQRDGRVLRPLSRDLGYARGHADGPHASSWTPRW